jgi:hypothetical protein
MDAQAPQFAIKKKKTTRFRAHSHHEQYIHGELILMSNKELDTILKYMVLNNSDIPTWADVIVKNSGIEMKKENSFLLMNKLYLDGYVSRTGTYAYHINGNGVKFISDGGYDKHAKQNKKQWQDRHPFFYAVILAIISGLVSLGVALIQHTSEKSEYNQIKQTVKTLSDSVAVLQKHIMDSSKHRKM